MSWIELVAQRHPPAPPAGMQPPENASDWFRIENNADDADTTDVLIYSSIGGWFGMWADEFVDELKAVTTSKINLRLNSPGGSVFDGIAIANAIRSHPATVTVYVDSLAASIASVIAMAGDRLVMMPQSQIMVHNASGACYGDATEMTKMADLLDKQSRNIAEAYAQHTGGSLADWQQYMADETWFTADEALAVGLADEVMPMKPKKEAPLAPAEARMHSTWDLSMYRYAGREQAPGPKTASPVTVMELAGVDVTEHLKPGQRVTAQMLASGIADLRNGIADAARPVAPEEPVAATPQTITIDLSGLGADESFQNMIRDLVRKSIADAAPPFLPKKGEGDEEEDDEDEEEAEDASTEEPEARTPEGPGENQQVIPEGADAPPVEQHVPEEIPPDEADHTTETYDKADDWTSVIGLLHSPTSPGADDVFAHLKEGW